MLNINDSKNAHQKKGDACMARNKIIEQFDIKNIINYLRRSRQDEDREKKTGEDTLHEQKQLMDRVLADYGVPYDQRNEIGSGDKISTRPVFQQIIKDVREGKYDAIAVKEISRMGRGSYTDMGTIYDLIVERRIYIITPWKIYDPTNPSDLRQIRFELFMSREEFETTRERLNGGRYNAALEGKWVSGKAPYGYKYNPHTKHLDINKDEAEIVRAIFDFYANGILLKNAKRKLVQFRALGTYLKRIGIKTPAGNSEWQAIQVRQLLENERFIGVLRQNTTKLTSDGKKIPRPESEHVVVYDAHPAIIDMELWNKVQYRINNREDTTNTKLDFEPCELAGICVCKKCGRKFIRRAAVKQYKKADGTISEYHNEFLFCGTTGCTYVKYRSVEEDILDTLKYLRELDADTLKKQLDPIIVNQEPSRSKEDIAKFVKSQLEELDRRMKFIYEKYEAGIYKDDEFVTRRNEIEKKIEELEKMEFVKDVKKETDAINPDFIKTSMTSVLEAYEKATSKTDKNKLLHSVFSHVDVEVLEKGNGRKAAIHVIEPFFKSSFLRKSV